MKYFLKISNYDFSLLEEELLMGLILMILDFININKVLRKLLVMFIIITLLVGCKNNNSAIV